MADTAGLPLSDDDITAQAQGLISYFLIAGALYAKQQGKHVQDWAHFIGQGAAPSWSQEHHGQARETVTAHALNCAAAGMPILNITGDEQHAELVTRDSDDFAEMIQAVGMTRAEADEIYSMLEPIATHLGLRYSRRREGDNLRFVFER